VDLGLLVLARATVTLRHGRLITKGEALTELRELGAPADVVRDLHDRRYARPTPMSRCSVSAEPYAPAPSVRRGIKRTLAAKKS
jgi:hypothetical protein